MMAQNTSEDKEIADFDSHETTKPSEPAVDDFLKPYFNRRDQLQKPSTEADKYDYSRFLGDRGKIYEEALETARPLNDTRSEAEREDNFGKIEDILVGEVEKDFKTYPEGLPDCGRKECWAARLGLVNIVVALVRREGADDPESSTTMSKGCLALAIAAEKNDLKMVEALKDIAVTDESFKSCEPDPPHRKNSNFLYKRCDKPVYILYPDHKVWLCPIEAAARLGHLEMVTKLIELRAAKMEPSQEELGDAMMKKSKKMTDEQPPYRRAFDWAVKMGHHDVVNFFIDKDYIVDLNQESSVLEMLDDAYFKLYGWMLTPLAFAVLCKDFEVVRMLCEAKKGGLKADVRSAKKKNALQMAFEVKRDKKAGPYDPKPADKIVRIIMERDEIKREVQRLTEERKVHVDAINAILVGTALIATATFAGWLSPPLGYSPQPGTDGLAFASVDGHPILEKFWVFNSLSFFFSIATFMVGANAARPPDEDDYIGEVVETLRLTLRLAYSLLTVAVFFVIGAFACAGFAVLPPITKYTVNMAVTVGIGVTVVVLSTVLAMWIQPIKRAFDDRWQSKSGKQ